MSVGLYADVHVPGPVILQLRLRGTDILAASEQGTNELSDEELLSLATSLERVMVTQDIRFRVMAEDWQQSGRAFAGLVFAHQRYVSFGEMIADLELMESPVRSREKGKGEFPALFAIYITFDSLIRFAISSSLIEPATVRLNLISFPQPCPCNRLARPGPRAATKEGKELKRIICR